MERKIKFRGKKKDGQWLYGNLIDCSRFRSVFDIAEANKIPVDILAAEIIRCEVDDSTIGQYTGLKDKNGKEIYEGDIVDWIFWCYIPSGEVDMHIKGVIEWHQGGLILKVLENDIENAGFYAISNLNTDTDSDVEILGNIYDNPNILED